MSSQLYIGNGQAAPAVVVEKPTPMPNSIQFVNNNGKLEGSNTFIDLSGITSIGAYALTYAYYNNTSISGEIDLSNIVSIEPAGLSYAFYGCTGITKVDLSSLTTLSGSGSVTGGLYQAFRNSSITSLDLSSLTTIQPQYNACQYMCYGCKNLAEVKFGENLTNLSTQCFHNAFEQCTSLTNFEIYVKSATANSFETAFRKCANLVSFKASKCRDANYAFMNAFEDCTSLTTVDLSNLQVIYGSYGCFNSAFKNCTSLTTLSFPELAYLKLPYSSSYRLFTNMLQGVTGCTVHFPSNIEAIIKDWSDVQSGFGGTNTQILYDLPATICLQAKLQLYGSFITAKFIRDYEKDTESSLAWSVFNDYLVVGLSYYTSGTSNPQVGDTIYSDPECTQAVTTIDSIS